MTNADRVFWPKTGIPRGRERGQAVGWRVEDVAVVVGIVDEWLTERACSELGLERLGEMSSSNDVAEGQANADLVHLRCSAPVSQANGPSIVLFDPPDPVRLRYLKESASSSAAGGHLEGQDDYGIGRTHNLVGMDRIVPLLNETKTTQRRLARLHGHSNSRAAMVPSLWPNVGELVTMLLSPVALLLHTVVWLSDRGPGGYRIRDHSSTIRQLALRAEQVLAGPADFVHTLHDPEVRLDDRSQRYVRFWNTVWLILNDLVLGYCAREVVVLLASQICPRLPVLFKRFLVIDVVQALAWLDDWPVGLKLNTPLSRFFRTAFTIVISSWGNTVQPLLSSHGGTLVRLVGLSGYGGFTLFVSVLRDLIAILSAHFRLCHALTLSLLKWQLDSLGGLWNLFRGKKWNVLRQRTDTYAYDVDQLFLGTLLFTVSAFLFPTVVAYAALFGTIRIGLSAVDKVLETVTQALNAFPLFEVLLRLKEPSRLPDGIIFRVRTSSARGDSTASLELRVSLFDTATA